MVGKVCTFAWGLRKCRPHAIAAISWQLADDDFATILHISAEHGKTWRHKGLNWDVFVGRSGRGRTHSFQKRDWTWGAKHR